MTQSILERIKSIRGELVDLYNDTISCDTSAGWEEINERFHDLIETLNQWESEELRKLK